MRDTRDLKRKLRWYLRKEILKTKTWLWLHPEWLHPDCFNRTVDLKIINCETGHFRVLCDIKGEYVKRCPRFCKMRQWKTDQGSKQDQEGEKT